MPKKVFISFPYNHQSKVMIDKRIAIANLYAYNLTLAGYIPMAPALIGHEMLREAKKNGIDTIGTDFDIWEGFCYEYMNICDEMHILMIPGWQESKGVAAEAIYANARNIKLRYIDTDDIKKLQSTEIGERGDVHDIGEG